MFCNNCGNKLEDGTKFCSNCGADSKATRKSLLLSLLLGMGIMLLLTVSVGTVIHFKGKTEDAEGTDNGKVNERSSIAFSGGLESGNNKSSIIDVEGNSYLVVKINDCDYDLSQNHTETARSMMKNKILLYDYMRMSVNAWNKETSEIQNISGLKLVDKGNAGNIQKDSALTAQDNDNMERFQDYAIILRAASPGGAIRGGARDGQQVFYYKYAIASRLNKDYGFIPKGELSYSTANGITEDSSWEDVIQINHGWESNGWYVVPNTALAIDGSFYPTHASDRKCLQTYTVIYENKSPIDTMAEQYEVELLQYEQEGKTISSFLEDKEFYSVLSAVENGAEDFLEWESYIVDENKYDFSAFVLALVCHESVMRYYNGEIDELAFVQYQMINGQGDISSLLPRNQLGVGVTVYSTEPVEKLQ